MAPAAAIVKEKVKYRKTKQIKQAVLWWAISVTLWLNACHLYFDLFEFENHEQDEISVNGIPVSFFGFIAVSVGLQFATLVKI